MQITKAAGVLPAGAPDAAQLQKINELTKSPLAAEDVYVFSVRLCDDQVDRDYERFSQQALKALAPMFIGKTGIADHAWSAERQTARIFDTSIEYEQGAMYIKAWAYMLRGEKTDCIIREIEGGIKKEVSVGCAVKKSICSVCGMDYGSCEHRKGEQYAGQLCTAVLCEPTDAYEFSFVAVPAQPQAGVLRKGLSPEMPDAAELKALKADAALGRQYRAELEQDVVRLGLLLDMGVDEKVLQRMARAMESGDLMQMRKALCKKRAELFPPMPQLQTGKETARENDSAFLI